MGKFYLSQLYVYCYHINIMDPLYDCDEFMTLYNPDTNAFLVMLHNLWEAHHKGFILQTKAKS